MHRISIIIPAYNEEFTIKKCLEDFHAACPDMFFVVVNNNSSDKTRAIAQKTMKMRGIDGIVIDEFRQGKGHAMRRAFQEVDSEFYVMVDADTTYSAGDLEKLMGPVLSGEADLVMGDRHSNNCYKNENKRRFHNFGNQLIKWIINFLFRSDLKDIVTGYRVFSRYFIKFFPLQSHGFELETEMTLHALDRNFKIKEVPVMYRDRPEKSLSKLNTFKDGIKVLWTIFWIFKYSRPFHLFMALSTIFFITGLIFGSVVIREFYLTGIVAHIPLAILSTGIMIISMMFFAIGIILDTVVRLDKSNYTIMLNLYQSESNKYESNISDTYDYGEQKKHCAR